MMLFEDLLYILYFFPLKVFLYHVKYNCQQEASFPSCFKGNDILILGFNLNILYNVKKEFLCLEYNLKFSINVNFKNSFLTYIEISMAFKILSVLRSREKEGAYTLCNSMDGTGESYAK